MRKKIIFISLFLFLVSFIIVLIYGRESTIEYDINNITNTTIKYDKKIIKCKIHQNNKKLVIDISPLKIGNTEIIIKGEKTNNDNAKLETIYKKKVYVHPTKVITINHFLGNCNGADSIIIAFILTLLITLLYSIRQFIYGIKRNIYEYRNIKLLGLSLFISNILIWNLYIYIIDTLNNYKSSLYMFINGIINSAYAISVFALPIALITSILVTISNIKLVIKEGKTWKNMLGVILGGFICISTILFITMNSLIPYDSNIHLYNILYGLSYCFLISISYLECILFGTIIIGFISAKKIPSYDKDYIIILGCRIKKDGTLLPLIKGRVDKAIEFAKKQKENTGKDIIYVPSGGQGSDENISEAEAMKNYLLEQNIDKNNIIIENKSTSTYENIKFSNKLINQKTKNPNIAFATTNYHVFRAGNIAANQNIYIEGIGSKTKPYYWINAFIREFIATLVKEKKKHIKTLIILWVLVIILMIINCLDIYI